MRCGRSAGADDGWRCAYCEGPHDFQIAPSVDSIRQTFFVNRPAPMVTESILTESIRTGSIGERRVHLFLDYLSASGSYKDRGAAADT